MEEDQFIAIHLHCHTQDQEKAAKAIDTLSRIMLGLTLDGLNVSLASLLVEAEEFEIEYEEIEGDDETGA